MSFFGVGNPFTSVVGQKIEQATDGALPSENWGLNMEICDLVNSSVDGPRDAIKAIRKRLAQTAGKNFTVVMYTLTVLETCVKNCGKPFHLLACNKEFVSELVKLIGPKNDPPTIVQEKVLSLIQCWADAFQNQPDLQGVVQVYQELRVKGVEFPMTDLDSLAPIFTPQRSVPDGVVAGEVPMAVTGSPQRVAHAPTSPARHAADPPPAAAVTLSPNQSSKLRADLAVVEGNMTVMADMLNEMATQAPASHHPSDIQLLNELAETLQAMQSRVAELVARLGGDGPLTEQLLHTNDQLNSLLLRHTRFIKNRGAAGSTAAPSAILGAAMGVPGSGDAQSGKPADDSLIDLSDDTPDIGSLNIRAPEKPSGASKDEFDMFAQSRNLTYENTKSGGSSYADNLEPGQTSAGLAATAGLRPAQPPSQSTEMDPREIDEIAAWLNQEKAAAEAASGAQESVTSSDFDKFLAERAAAADSLPDAAAAAPSAAPSASPHRHVDRNDGSKFAL